MSRAHPRRPPDVVATAEMLSPADVIEIIPVTLVKLAGWRRAGFGPPWFPLQDDKLTVVYRRSALMAWIETQEQEHAASGSSLLQQAAAGRLVPTGRPVLVPGHKLVSVQGCRRAWRWVCACGSDGPARTRTGALTGHRAHKLAVQTDLAEAS